MIVDDPKELKKRELLDKCFELFVRKGLENTSLNELAAYCNMHKATFYSYLTSKDEIVVESAKQYMEKVDKMFFDIFENPQKTLKGALQYGFEVIAGEKNKFKYIYQVISSPKYGEQSRDELTKVYMKYMNYSNELANIYNVNHSEFRPYIYKWYREKNDSILCELLDNNVKAVTNCKKWLAYFSEWQCFVKENYLSDFINEDGTPKKFDSIEKMSYAILRRGQTMTRVLTTKLLV